jgi:hypothetical protein
MERTVPSTVSEEVELYLRTVYSLLRSSTEIQIRTLEEVHAGMNSSLHPDARKPTPDVSALVYSLLRLPACVMQARKVLLGQEPGVFARSGYADIERWQPVAARARRRRCYFNGQDILACFIASASDIDDVVPALTALQIEWNKMHVLLKQTRLFPLPSAPEPEAVFFPRLAQALGMRVEDLERLRTVWGKDFYENFETIAARPSALRLQLLSGSLSEYWRATRTWWDKIEAEFPAMLERPVYFVSSNTHSLINLLSGFALRQHQELLDFIHWPANRELQEEWQNIEAHRVPASQENFLYYALKKYQQTPRGKDLLDQQVRLEAEQGIHHVYSEHSFDLEAQVIELSKLDPEWIDPRLKPAGGTDWSFLRRSDACILNIDYPLGLAAYNILAKVAEHISSVLGVYTMGKAATLNAVKGDVMIPNVVQDEHSRNTYLFQNCFSAADLTPYMAYGTVLDNQKAVTVLGTFIQNSRVMDVVYREGYTDLEMEAGPYLSAVYEMTRPTRHPVDEIINLTSAPFDIGVLHYASDTPLSKGQNLGAGTLAYAGMDSTYAASLAIARRILLREKQRLG